MCSGGGGSGKAQRRADQQAAQNQAELDRIAEEERQLAERQQAELAAWESRIRQHRVRQRKKSDRLRVEQTERVGGIRAAGQAASSTLKILAEGQPMAPTAAMSRPKQRARGPRPSRASLRIGQTSTGSGAGSNLSV